jgi:MFS family permease
MLRWFPQKSASLPVGIASSGLFIGFGTGSLLMSFFVPTSIQTTADMFNGFLIFGILAIVAFLVWIAVGKDHPRISPEERRKVEKMKLGEGLKHTLNSRNAYAYPIIGFFIGGITLVTSAFLNQLYPGNEGGYVSGLLLYGCAIGAFVAPFIAKRIGLKKVAQSTIVGAIFFWLVMFAFNSCGISWLLIISVAFLFGVCLQTSWPLALYSQETEEGVSEANAGIAASLYISISNIGAAVLPVLFPLLFKTNLSNFVAILVGLILCTAPWGIVKRK